MMLDVSLSSAKRNKPPEGLRNIPFLLVLLPSSAGSIENESINIYFTDTECFSGLLIRLLLPLCENLRGEGIKKKIFEKP